MNQFPRLVMEAVKLLVSFKRIDDFLNCEDFDPVEVKQADLSLKNSIQFSDASFSWSKSDETPTLQNLDLNILKGSLGISNDLFQ